MVLITEEYSNQDIANDLQISLATVKSHVRNILLKLEGGSCIEAAAKAY
jgi:LuxR family maltose regulon positive regulatory protein